MLDVNRVERKFVLTAGVAEDLCAKLRKLLPGDEFAGYEPYTVRSLYFDSYHNDDFADKVDGLLSRKKIRIRIYDTSDQTAKLELKQKRGENQRKQSLTITREQVYQMIAGQYEFLREMNAELAGDIYYIMIKETYRPKCIVNYKRRAFALPTNNIRITFDSEIESSEGNFDLFSPSRAFTYPVDSKNLVILEVKYNHFLLSYVKDALHMADMTETSYSKYLISRKHGLL